MLDQICALFFMGASIYFQIKKKNHPDYTSELYLIIAWLMLIYSKL